MAARVEGAVKIDIKDPPRRFRVGNSVKFDMQDCARIELQADEQVTFVTERGAEFDVARKDWGFYATPSLNGRLVDFGLRAVLIRNTLTERYFVLLVERSMEAAFEAYLIQESCEIVAWLDSGKSLDNIRARLS